MLRNDRGLSQDELREIRGQIATRQGLSSSHLPLPGGEIMVNQVRYNYESHELRCKVRKVGQAHDAERVMLPDLLFTIFTAAFDADTEKDLISVKMLRDALLGARASVNYNAKSQFTVEKLFDRILSFSPELRNHERYQEIVDFVKEIDRYQY